MILFDTVIIGGGASGLSTAIMLKRQCPKLNIAIIEKLDRVGKKISVTGNGRCNITNCRIESKNYYSNNISKAMNIIFKFSLDDVKKFFSSVGVEICFENGKGYPRSFQASSVVDALRFTASNLGIVIFTSNKILDINKKSNLFNIILENKIENSNILNAKSVVISTGGLAGGSKLGSDGDGYKFLKKFGHNIIPRLPVIVQVKTENAITRSLKGIKVDAAVKIYKNSKMIANDYGEVLFCDYGLSGPPIFQLSRHCTQDTVISLDLLNEINQEDLTKLIIKRKNIFHGYPLTEFFAGLLHKKLGQAILKYCSIALSDNCETLTDKDCKSIAKNLKDFKFKVSGNTGFVNAQATSGGADLNDFNGGLMSLKCKGLFATGEVLDVDGDCGGYNLHWAWSSAKAVADSISSFLGSKS